jgi:hypothetical protein
MALVHEDGTGKADAESFASVADADAYFVKYGASAAWTAADDATKEVGLRTAARRMRALYRGAWIGRRYLETQALSWPRSEAWDEDGYLISHTIVPPAVRDANTILAGNHVDGDDLMADVSDDAAVTSESVKIGPIAVAQEFAGAKPVEKQYPLVDELLRPLLIGTNRTIRA